MDAGSITINTGSERTPRSICSNALPPPPSSAVPAPAQGASVENDVDAHHCAVDAPSLPGMQPGMGV